MTMSENGKREMLPVISLLACKKTLTINICQANQQRFGIIFIIACIGSQPGKHYHYILKNIFFTGITDSYAFKSS
jgi:hypothetical protein